MKRVSLLHGDITQRRVDAIVNAANSSLLGGGGVDGAIHRAGGPAILAACREIRTSSYPDGLPTGEAVITTAGNMAARFVIHTVGPVWHGGARDEARLLANAYLNSLNLARDHDTDPPINSIAFPAISTGVYGYPKRDAFAVALEVFRTFVADNERPQHIEYVVFGASDYELYTSMFA